MTPDVSFLDLMDRVQRGDTTAAEDIYRRYAQQLVRLAARHLVGLLRRKVDPARTPP